MKATACILALALCQFGPARADVVVPLRTIQPGEVVSAADLALAPGTAADAVVSAHSIDGMQALVPLYANRPIRNRDIGPVTLIERNQFVTARFELNGLSITSLVRSLGAAGVGQEIQVMNPDSRKIVSGIVAADGVVLVSGNP